MINSNNQGNQNRVIATSRGSQNTPFLELLNGKKIFRKLPDNFFEKVIEEELTLKRHFTIESLQSLVDLYSVILNNLLRLQ